MVKIAFNLGQKNGLNGTKMIRILWVFVFLCLGSLMADASDNPKKPKMIWDIWIWVATETRIMKHLILIN
jgi:hypothetical protein